MSSDASRTEGAGLPSAEKLQELLAALKTACSEIAAARGQVEADCKSEVEAARAETVRFMTNAHAATEGHRRQLHASTETAARKLAELEQRAASLADRLKGELDASEGARRRAEAAIESFFEAMQQVRTDRETWDAQAQAADQRNGAALQELRRSLAKERERVTALEVANKQLLEAQEGLEERLTALEKKKVFGLF